MNRKGFTLVELMATLVVLGIILGITIISISSIFSKTKEKSEDVFVDTIKDAMEMYLNSKTDLNEDISDDEWSMCNNKITKKHGQISVSQASITFDDVINSQFKPITRKDLVNPANKDVSCVSVDKDNGETIEDGLKKIEVTIYRDDDFVYYYSINKRSFGCLKNKDGVITNLPWINVDYDKNSDGVQDEKDGYFYQCG